MTLAVLALSSEASVGVVDLAAQLRQCHLIDGRHYDRPPFDPLACEHKEI